jgi:flagellar protein FlaG
MSVDIGPVTPSAAGQTAGVARSAPNESDFSVVRGEVAEQAAPREEQTSQELRANALLERLIDTGPNFDARLSIDQDDVTGSFVYRILDVRTGEVLRQFPDEDRLELLRYLGERQGLIVDQRI